MEQQMFIFGNGYETMGYGFIDDVNVLKLMVGSHGISVQHFYDVYRTMLQKATIDETDFAAFYNVKKIAAKNGCFLQTEYVPSMGRDTQLFYFKGSTIYSDDMQMRVPLSKTWLRHFEDSVSFLCGGLATCIEQNNYPIGIPIGAGLNLLTNKYGERTIIDAFTLKPKKIFKYKKGEIWITYDKKNNDIFIVNNNGTLAAFHGVDHNGVIYEIFGKLLIEYCKDPLPQRETSPFIGRMHPKSVFLKIKGVKDFVKVVLLLGDNTILTTSDAGLVQRKASNWKYNKLEQLQVTQAFDFGDTCGPIADAMKLQQIDIGNENVSVYILSDGTYQMFWNHYKVLDFIWNNKGYNYGVLYMFLEGNQVVKELVYYNSVNQFDKFITKFDFEKGDK